jgi:arylmalonate decarboxylase
MTYEPVVPRARIGFIIPSSNRMIEPQMQRFMPAGVVPHFNRIGMTNRHKAPLEKLLPRIIEAADLLNDSKCNVIVLQCTGTSMSGGVDMDKRVVEEIGRATGRPALSTASALTAAFKSLGVRRLVFVSETAQEGHDKKVQFLKEAGYDIVADKATALAGTDAYCTTPPQFWYDTVLGLRRDETDAYFMSCTNIHSIDVIEKLERELKKPVITSNQASIWCALRMIGIREAVPGLGYLLRHDAEAMAAAE